MRYTLHLRSSLSTYNFLFLSLHEIFFASLRFTNPISTPKCPVHPNGLCMLYCILKGHIPSLKGQFSLTDKYKTIVLSCPAHVIISLKDIPTNADEFISSIMHGSIHPPLLLGSPGGEFGSFTSYWVFYLNYPLQYKCLESHCREPILVCNLPV